MATPHLRRSQNRRPLPRLRPWPRPNQRRHQHRRRPLLVQNRRPSPTGLCLSDRLTRVSVDTGPVPGETKEQKIERLQKVVAGAKQRSDEGGGAEHEPAAAPVAIADLPEQSEPVAEPATAAPTDATPAPAVAATPAPTTSHTSSGEPDRTLFKRSTYAGVVDTGPVPGETHEQKIERLTKLAAAAKQKSEEGG